MFEEEAAWYMHEQQNTAPNHEIEELWVEYEGPFVNDASFVREYDRKLAEWFDNCEHFEYPEMPPPKFAWDRITELLNAVPQSSMDKKRRHVKRRRKS